MSLSRLLGSLSRQLPMRARLGAQAIVRRRMGGGGHHGPHVPPVHYQLGKFLLVSCYFWLFYKFYHDGPQLFGLYRPWEHEGHHHEHYQFVEAGSEGDAMATIEEHGEEDDEIEEEEEESDE